MQGQISSFRDRHAFLSNFYERPFVHDGMTWRSGEHAYQAAKADESDKLGRYAIKMARTPAVAKRLGQKVKMRADWDEVKVEVMRGIVRSKFADPEMAAMLLSTGDAELVEGNTWGDKTWGCVMEGGEWEGRNMLGRILMDVRAELRRKNEG